MEDGNKMRSGLLLDIIYVDRRYIRFSISAIKWFKSSITRRERILTGIELTFLNPWALYRYILSNLALTATITVLALMMIAPAAGLRSMP